MILKNKFVALMLVGVLAVSASGCLALFLGAAAGAGGYAYVSGALEKTYTVPADELKAAAIRGIRSLDMDIYEEGDRLFTKIRSSFADGSALKVDVKALTEKTSELKIRVGVLGDKDRSEMVLNAIEKYL